MENLIKDMNNSKIFDYEITLDNILDNLDIYNSFINCKNCKGLDECKNSSIGFINTKKGLKECHYLKKSKEINEMNANLSSLFFPKKLIDEASIENFEITNQSRCDLLDAFNFLINTNDFRGLYVYGSNGMGKTYFMAAVANYYKSKNKKVILTFIPDLIRYFRTIRYNQLIEEKVYELKNTDCLILDDLGLEIHDEWFNKEILTPILNYRLQMNLKTFFTSNYSIRELVEKCDKTFEVEAKRLLRRICSLTLFNPKNKINDFEIRKD